MIAPLPDHARIDRHFCVELSYEYHRVEVAKLAKYYQDYTSRSWGQMIRQHRERMERVMMESENMGDEAGCCSGLAWGDC